MKTRIYAAPAVKGLNFIGHIAHNIGDDWLNNNACPIQCHRLYIVSSGGIIHIYLSSRSRHCQTIYNSTIIMK